MFRHRRPPDHDTRPGLAGLSAATLVLLLISRAYTTALQNRIIKVEMSLRAAALLSSEQQRVFGTLAKPQIIALRFASDENLPGLVERAGRESMTADQIKRAIRNWRPDLDRTWPLAGASNGSPADTGGYAFGSSPSRSEVM